MKLLLSIQCLLFLSLSVFSQNFPTPMDKEKWQEDLTYLNNKIQKTFSSYVPGVKENFAEEVEKLANEIPQLGDEEIVIRMMAALATLKDGHTEINIGRPEIGFRRLPFVLYFFEGDLYITKAHEQYKDLLGARITHFGTVETGTAFKRLQTIMSHDNKMEFLHAGPGYIILGEVLQYLDLANDAATPKLSLLLPGQKTKTLEINTLDRDSYIAGPWTSILKEKGHEPLYLQNPQESYWYEYLEDQQVLYFHFRRVNNQKGAPSIAKFTKQLFKVIDEKKPNQFIIDFRHNNGGNYNLSAPLLKEIKKRPWLNQKGKIWAITGRTTFSASSTTCIFLKQETTTQIIGEPGRTHPNKADNNEYMRLPNSNILVEHTTRIKKHWPEIAPLDYIPVDVEIVPSFEAYQKGEDQVLNYLFEN